MCDVRYSNVCVCGCDAHIEFSSHAQHHLNGHTDKVHAAVFGADSQHVYSTSQDHTLKAWDATKGVFEASVMCWHVMPCAVLMA